MNDDTTVFKGVMHFNGNGRATEYVRATSRLEAKFYLEDEYGLHTIVSLGEHAPPEDADVADATRSEA